jgi:transcription elongation factor GreA
MTDDKKFYLTLDSLKKLKKEYQALKAIRNAKTKGEAPKVFESEDLNPEFVSFQEDVNFLDVRLAELENILKNVELIKIPKKEKQNVVNLGATVLVEVDDGQKDEFTIVGSLEANPSLGRISNDSPVGRSLMGRKTGDKVVISSPVKTIYKIKKIEYKNI